MDDRRIGYVGLGNMGGALARRLMVSGEVAAFDLNPALRDQFAAAGAQVCRQAADLAARCDVIFLCLPTSDHVEQALFGPQGMAPNLRAGQLVIDQSTGFPQTTRQIAARLATLGVGFVDAPVSGGPSGAAAGTIAIMAGGSADDLARALPILGRISANITQTGAVGSGQVVKIVNNMVSFSQRLLTYEALALGCKNGVDPAVIAQVLGTSTAQNGYIHRVLPKVLRGDLAIGFTLGLTVKDMDLACDLAKASGVPLAVARMAQDVYQEFSGVLPPQAEIETVVRLVESAAGIRFVPDAATGPAPTAAVPSPQPPTPQRS